MTAALVEDYKRPRDWVEIARLVTNAGADDDSDFIWFGEGPLRGEAQVLADATVPGRASFPGWSDDLEGSYGSARVYLQTSSIESLGLSVVDALRHGIPAVVTRAGGLPEVVLDGVNGFVVSVGDTQAAAKAVVELLRNDDLWNQQALAARTVYQERFSPEMWDQSLLAAHG
jgi:glycosyltransferase involved in cell wall biosynthesis